MKLFDMVHAKHIITKNLAPTWGSRVELQADVISICTPEEFKKETREFISEIRI